MKVEFSFPDLDTKIMDGKGQFGFFCKSYSFPYLVGK